MVQEVIFKKEQPKQKNTPIHNYRHFEYEFNNNEAREIFDKLIDKGYISKETEFNHFVYWFTGGKQLDNLKPIKWLKPQNILTCLIDTFFSDSGISHWEITKDAFRIKDKEPNIKTMKKDASDYRNQIKEFPKGNKEIKQLLNL